MTPKLEEFLKPEVVQSIQNYLAARVIAELKRSQVDKIQRLILTEKTLRATLCTVKDTYPERAALARERGNKEENGDERITDPNLVYLCQDEALMEWYFSECNRRERETGIKPADMPDDHCPALTAEHLVITAENHLIDVSGEHIGLESTDIYGKKREEWINLVVKLVTNHPTTAKHFKDAGTILQRYR